MEDTLRRQRPLSAILALLVGGCAAAADGYPSVNPLIANQSLADGVPYFENLRWGMTEAQVTALYPAIVREQEKHRTTPRLVPVLHRKLFGDCQFAVTFGFYPEPLISVSFELEDGNNEDCRNLMYNDLIARFGDRPHIYKGKIERGGDPGEPILVQVGTVTYTRWLGKVTTIIHLQQDFFPRAREEMVFQLSLSHTGAPGTYIE